MILVWLGPEVLLTYPQQHEENFRTTTLAGNQPDFGTNRIWLRADQRRETKQAPHSRRIFLS